MKELISVIIPVYNVEIYLENCINSVLNQSYKNIEIILVDDGSIDNSGKLCDEFALKDSRIKVFHKNNGGLSDARNKGIELSNGKYLVFIDSDDVVNYRFIEYLVNLVKDTGCDIGICDPVHCYPNKQINYVDESERHIYSSKDAICEMLYQKSFLVSAWGKIYPKKYFDELRFPVGIIFEDSAIMYKIFAKAQRIAYGNAKLYGYMHRENSITTKKFSKRDCDIIIICDQIVDDMGNKSPELQKAAASYQTVGALRIYLNAKGNAEFDEEVKQCIQIIKQNGKCVLFNTRARRKTRIAILMFYIARPIMQYVHRKVDRWK